MNNATQALTRGVTFPLATPLIGSRSGSGEPTSWVDDLEAQFGLVPNYIVDPDIGNDLAAGTEAAPWATLTKLAAVLNVLPAAATRVAFVRGQTYTNQHLNLSIGTNTGINITIAFEEGATILWTAGTDQSGINIGPAVGNTLTIQGNGLHVTGFTVGSGNGLSSNNSDLIAHDVRVTNCIDGVSGHGAGDTTLYDCHISDCTKGAAVHVGTGVHTAERCTFVGRAAASIGLGSLEATNVGVFTDCTFTPISAGQAFSPQKCAFLRCIVGTLALRVGLGASTGMSMTDCFVNISSDLSYQAAFTQCYGKASFRIRGTAATADAVFRKCVFIGNSSGLTTGLLYGAFDDASGNWDGVGYDFRDCIVTGFATAFGAGFSAGQFTSFNVNSKLDNICTFGNTTGIHASITVETAQLTANPLLGPANTYIKSDYGYLPGSPCIGAGFGGGNIGFAA